MRVAPDVVNDSVELSIELGEDIDHPSQKKNGPVQQTAEDKMNKLEETERIRRHKPKGEKDG